MKQLFTILAAISFIAVSYGANPYTITFSGSGATLQTVHVENMTKGSSVDMNATDVLRLVLVTKVDNINANAEQLRVYPNPMNQSCNIQFNNENTGKVNIQIIDLSGKTVFIYNRLMASGEHEFMLSGLAAGVYVVNVKTTSIEYTNKIISTNLIKSKLDFTEISSGNKSNAIVENSIQKSKAQETTTIDMQYSTGDQLKFIGYATGYANNTIYASPTATAAYTFNFVAPYYRITGNTIASSSPCFVDIMFSVNDVNYKGVDNLSNTDFTVQEDNTVISPTETFRYIRSISTVPYTIKTVIMIDNSASIGANLAQIKSAALTMVNSIGKNQLIAVYSFSDNATLLQDYTNDVSKLTTAINGITLGFPSTNLFGSFITGLSSWSDIYSVDGITKGFLVLFTDGDDTQGSYTLLQATSAIGQKSTYIIGLGSEIQPSNLNALAHPSPYYAASNVSELSTIFGNIQKDIYKFANSFYWLNYMTPKRSNTHTLKIQIKNNTNSTSDASYQGSFSAAGFQSVLSGVYFNTTETKFYGEDSIVGVIGNNYDAKAVSYWATNPPGYKWTSANTAIATVSPIANYFNKASIRPLSPGVTTVTLRDTANSYSKSIKIISQGSPILTTNSITNLTANSFDCGGNISFDGGLPITDRGVCWATTQSPTKANSRKSAGGTAIGAFNVSLTGLADNTKYYARAYATNSLGTGYGQELSFITLPSVSTTAASNITTNTATCGGTINVGGAATTITARGVCWSTNQNPTITDSKTTDGTGTGTFTSSLTGLTAGTTYYVRAYATNSVTTSYGTQITLTTMGGIASLTTTTAGSITATTATSGGSITADGGAAITARGVCWSTSQNPTITDSKTTDGTGTGTFTSSLSGLTANTIYYIRAYATNSATTSYGLQKTFTTMSGIATLSTTAASNITITSATSGGSITADGGAAITARGICWSTSQNPTIADSKTTDGVGIGSFTSSLTGLTLNTKYYVRAYATSALGTVYSSEISFTTKNGIATLNTTTASNITITSATSGGNITDDGGAAITARGLCWSTSPNPTIANSKTADGTGTGTFTSSLSGLTANSTYYVRAYATNSVTTSYGTELSFSTPMITYTTANGLTGNYVNAIAIDAQGNKWFGTNGGISKFDGTTWTSYTTANGLADNNVYSIAIDAQGNKWFGTNGGVSKYDGATWTTYTTANGLAFNYVRSIAIDAQGIKWFGTWGGVSKFDGTTWTTYNTANGLANNTVNRIAIDAQGNKWFGTDGGVSKFNGTSWTTYTITNGLADNRVFSIAIDAQGNKWFGTANNGVCKFDGNTWTNYTTANGLVNYTVRSIVIDAQGNKWFGTLGGVSKFDGTTWTTYTTANGLANNSVYSISIDAQGNKWFGTAGGVSVAK